MDSVYRGENQYNQNLFVAFEWIKIKHVIIKESGKKGHKSCVENYYLLYLSNQLGKSKSSTNKPFYSINMKAVHGRSRQFLTKITYYGNREAVYLLF